MKPMRRFKQALNNDDCKTVLSRNEFGVLCLKPDDDFPYGVPLNYSFVNDKIYLHSAKAGYKIDALNHNPNVCFTVIDTAIEDYESYSEFFRSVIVFGTAKIIDDRDEKIKSIKIFAEKLSPGNPRLNEWIERFLDKTSLIEIDIDHFTGKESIEYVHDDVHLNREKPDISEKNTVISSN